MTAVAGAFGDEIDYARQVKLYGVDPEGEKRYIPARCPGTDTTEVSGDPDPAHVSIGYVERQNLPTRMGMRRSTRLTSAFSLHFKDDTFARVHLTPKTASAVKGGVADRV